MVVWMAQSIRNAPMVFVAFASSGFMSSSRSQAVGVDRRELGNDGQLDAAVFELALKGLESRKGGEWVLAGCFVRRDVNERHPIRESVGCVSNARRRAGPKLVEHRLHQSHI